MIESEQSRDMGQEWFTRLQEEIASASDEDLKAFLTARNADSMGFYGKEGVDDGD